MNKRRRFKAKARRNHLRWTREGKYDLSRWTLTLEHGPVMVQEPSDEEFPDIEIDVGPCELLSAPALTFDAFVSMEGVLRDAYRPSVVHSHGWPIAVGMVLESEGELYTVTEVKP